VQLAMGGRDNHVLTSALQLSDCAFMDPKDLVLNAKVAMLSLSLSEYGVIPRKEIKTNATIILQHVSVIYGPKEKQERKLVLLPVSSLIKRRCFHISIAQGTKLTK